MWPKKGQKQLIKLQFFFHYVLVQKNAWYQAHLNYWSFVVYGFIVLVLIKAVVCFKIWIIKICVKFYLKSQQYLRGQWITHWSMNWHISLQWRHNGHDGISNHQPPDCLLSRLFRCRSKKTSKLCVTGFCAGNTSVTGEIPAQMASNAENVSIWWRHHVMRFHELSQPFHCWD